MDPFNLTLGGYYISAGQAGVPTHQNTYGKALLCEFINTIDEGQP